MPQPSAATQPRLGAFLTMTVGLLLFFGLVSRIHEVPNPMLAVSRTETDEDPQEVLDARRHHVSVVVGTQDGTEPTEAGERLPPGPLEESPPAEDATEPAPAQPETPAPARPRETSRKRYYAIPDGDTLWRIAQRQYGDGNLHYLIQHANPWIDPDNLPVGFELLIPPREAAQHVQQPQIP